MLLRVKGYCYNYVIDLFSHSLYNWRVCYGPSLAFCLGRRSFKMGEDMAPHQMFFSAEPAP